MTDFSPDMSQPNPQHESMHDYLCEAWHLNPEWMPSDQQQRQFLRLYDLILEANQQFNLTRITEPADFWEKHLWDSLQGVARWLDPSALDQPEATDLPQISRVIDIGTGGGFPGIPVAIARPDWQVTLLDSTRKKVNFLKALCQTMGLKQMKTICDRAEQVGQMAQQRETYDLALIRAVGSASACAEYALPLLKIGGAAVLYRGQWSTEETEALQPVVQQLGGQIQAVEQSQTPITQSIRHCIYLEKVATTPADFPRAVGIPTKAPL